MSAEVSDAVPPQAVADYMQAVRDLTSEIARGMRAVADNRIEELQCSLMRQQALCAVLRPAYERWQRLCDNDAVATPDVATVIAAQKELLATTRAYKGLVERGRRSASLLAALCGSHMGQYSIHSWPLRRRLHLSCEA